MSSILEVSGWEPHSNVVTGFDLVSDLCASLQSASVERSFCSLMDPLLVHLNPRHKSERAREREEFFPLSPL